MTRTLAWTLLVALGGAGCGDGSEAGGDADRTKLGFVTNGVSSFWVLAQAGAEDAARAHGVDVDVLMPVEGITEQKRMVEDLVTRGVDGIAVSPIDPRNQVDLLDQAARHTNLITHDSDAPDSQRLCYVGLDNYEAGRLCGELVEEALPAGGEVYLFIGRLEQDNARRRQQGLIDALCRRERDPARYDPPGRPVVGSRYTVLGTATDQGDRAKAKANVEDVLARHPGVDVMVGLFAYNPPVILEALTQAGKLGQVTVVAFDEADETLAGILNGSVYATVVQNPYDYGRRSIEILAALAAGDRSVLPPSGVVDIPARAIRQRDVEAFRADLESKLGRDG